MLMLLLIVTVGCFVTSSNADHRRQPDRSKLLQAGSLRCVSKTLVQSPIVYEYGNRMMNTMGIVNGSYDPSQVKGLSVADEYFVCNSKFSVLALSTKFGVIRFPDQTPHYEGAYQMEQLTYPMGSGSMMRSNTDYFVSWIADGEQIDEKSGELLGNQMKLFLDNLSRDRATIFASRVKYNAAFKPLFYQYENMKFYMGKRKNFDSQAIYGMGSFKYGKLPEIDMEFVGIPLEGETSVTAYFIIHKNWMQTYKFKTTLDSINITDLLTAQKSDMKVYLPQFDVTSLSHDLPENHGYNHLQIVSLKMAQGGFGDAAYLDKPYVPQPEFGNVTEFMADRTFGIVIADDHDGKIILTAVVNQPIVRCSNLLQSLWSSSQIMHPSSLLS